MAEHVNDNQVRDYDVVLDAEFGAPGTTERAAAEELTQAELASRIGATKSYISKIENGAMTPSVGTFYRIISALGLQVIIARPLANT